MYKVTPHWSATVIQGGFLNSIYGVPLPPNGQVTNLLELIIFPLNASLEYTVITLIRGIGKVVK